MNRIEWIVFNRLKKKYPNWTTKQLIIGTKYALALYTKGDK